MKRFLFRIRRSDWLHRFVLAILSFLGSLTIAAAVLAAVMFRFGMEQPGMAAADRYELLNWLEMQNVDYENVFSFLMVLQPALAEITESFHIYGVLMILGIFLLLVLLLYLAACAGYHTNQPSPCLRGLERIPYDLLILLTVIWIACILGWMYNTVFYSYFLQYILIGFLGWCTLLIGSILLFFMITLAKLRTKTLFSGMLLSRAVHIILYCIRKIPAVWKATSIWGGILAAISFYVFLIYDDMQWYYYAPAFIVIWTFIILALFFAGVWIFLQMDAIRKKANLLACGNLEEESTCPLLPAFKDCMQDLNRISDGMNIAVEEKLKSERFQTELITNVSHDIKTPLTSIINYLDFLSQEEQKEHRNPQVVQEYIEVLNRQSNRLKKLIEDLIEVSKASTGSLNIQKEPCELGIFLQQIVGEYEEQLEQTRLTLNLSLPEEKIYVEADGRYLWRVVDNLLQNACKYALSGTRIYLQLQEQEKQAVITMKNISAAELNIPAAELMERFVRGDRSRHSEGSGLGLSIAKSLTELQGGQFAIEIDGDLFKTAIILPVIPQDKPLDHQKQRGSAPDPASIKRLEHV